RFLREGSVTPSNPRGCSNQTKNVEARGVICPARRYRAGRGISFTDPRPPHGGCREASPRPSSNVPCATLAPTSTAAKSRMLATSFRHGFDKQIFGADKQALRLRSEQLRRVRPCLRSGTGRILPSNRSANLPRPPSTGRGLLPSALHRSFRPPHRLVWLGSARRSYRRVGPLRHYAGAP